MLFRNVLFNLEVFGDFPPSFPLLTLAQSDCCLRLDIVWFTFYYICKYMLCDLECDLSRWLLLVSLMTMWVLLYRWCVFFIWLMSEFLSLSLILSGTICLGIVFWTSILLHYLWSFCIYGFVVWHYLRKFLALLLFFKISFPFSLDYLSDNPIICLLLHLQLPHNS